MKHLVGASLLAFALGTPSCKQKPGASSRVGYIIGANNIKPLKQETKPEKNDPAIAASVLIATLVGGKSMKFCSGVLVEHEATLKVLSNHHCFAKTDDKGITLNQLIPESCVTTQVYLGFSQLTDFKPEVIACKPGSLRSDMDGDLSILELEKAPESAYQTLSFWSGPADAKDRTALIIHHPAQEGNMKTPPGGLSPLPIAAVTNADCKVLGSFEANEWTLDKALAHGIRHTCDIIKGSSGSALIDAETNEILGINWGGIKIRNKGELRIDNVATWVPYIEAFIDGNTETIKNERIGMLDATKTEGKKVEKELGYTEKITKGTEKALCGSISSRFPMKTSSSWILFLLLSPILWSIRRILPYMMIALFLVFHSPQGKSEQRRPTQEEKLESSWSLTYLYLTIFSQESPKVQDEYYLARQTFLNTKSRAIGQNFSHNIGQTTTKVGSLLFANEKLQSLWQKLNKSIKHAEILSCETPFEHLAAYAKRQTSADANQTKLHLDNIDFFNKLKQEEQACFIISLSASPISAWKKGYSPTPLFRHVKNANIALQGSPVFKALEIANRIKVKEFPTALQLLSEAMQKESSPQHPFKLAYILVQRMYAQHQKGQGRVALGGM